MIVLDRATKLYGLVIGANDVSVALEPGAYGLLGPNGSGKTTLLNLLTGQLRPTLGRVETLDANPWNNPSVLRRLGLCPATDIPYNDVSAFDWLSYLLELYGIERRAARSRAVEVLEQVGLRDALSRPMGTYSRGMRQRAKLAQALAHDPELLILDEPFNGLDPVGRHEMTEWLRSWARRGRSLLLASHVLHEVEAVSSEFLLICGGRLLASGSAAEIRSLLANLAEEVRIVCDGARVLGQQLLASGLVNALRLEDGGRALVVSTSEPLQLYQELPRCAGADGVRIHELRAPDESLQGLFESLLRVHRGEAP
jgi:ABC-2 type transport system ATP-binding protein